MFGRKGVETYFCVPLNERPVRLSVRTAPFHGAKTGSIPVPATRPAFSGLFYGSLHMTNEYAVKDAAIFIPATTLPESTKESSAAFFYRLCVGIIKKPGNFPNQSIPKWVRKCELLIANLRQDLRNLRLQTDLFT